MEQQNQQTPFRYSKEEMRVLQECNRESFYNRCLPMSTAFGVATYYAVKSGKLNPSPKLGAVPKVFGACIVGYLIGKISYQRVCAEKLMALPDSKLGEILRNRYSGKKALTMDMPESDSFISGMKDEEKYDDVKKTSHMDLDTDRPSFQPLDDTYRPPPVDSFVSTDYKDIPIPKQPPTTYEELRLRNREEYEKNKPKPYRGVLTQNENPPMERRESRPRDDWFDSQPPPSKNVYGDPWDK